MKGHEEGRSCQSRQAEDRDKWKSFWMIKCQVYWWIGNER